MAISGLSFKITAPIVLIAVLATGLTGFLNLGKFERTLSELENSRTQFVVSDIHANLETGLALGLSLKGLANAQEVIDFEASKDPSILSISIYDEMGTVAFHTGQPLTSPKVSPSWKPPAGDKNGTNWRISTADEHIVGTNLVSVIGAPIGGLALRYSQRQHNDLVQSLADSLLLSSAVGIAVTTAVAILGIHLLIGGTGKKLERIEASLEFVIQEIAAPQPAAGSDADSLVAGVISSTRAVMQDLAAGQKSFSANLSGRPKKETP
jgi:hypothetical protein